MFFSSFPLGELESRDYIPGAEALNPALEDPANAADEKAGNRDNEMAEPSAKRRRIHADESEDSDDGSGSDSEWEDVVHTTDDEDGDDDGDDAGEKPEKEFLSLEEKQARAKEVTANRILTDADFRKIDALQLKKQVRFMPFSSNITHVKVSCIALCNLA